MVNGNRRQETPGFYRRERKESRGSRRRTAIRLKQCSVTYFSVGDFSSANSEPRFSHTSRIPISDGDTPEMREAWPTVAGRIFVNFWRASFRKLGMEA